MFCLEMYRHYCIFMHKGNEYLDFVPLSLICPWWMILLFFSVFLVCHVCYLSNNLSLSSQNSSLYHGSIPFKKTFQPFSGSRTIFENEMFCNQQSIVNSPVLILICEDKRSSCYFHDIPMVYFLPKSTVITSTNEMDKSLFKIT